VPPELAAVQLKRRTPQRSSLQQLQSNLQAMALAGNSSSSGGGGSGGAGCGSSGGGRTAPAGGQQR
jgi:hypothetical protein